jgi:hypothetical protein
MNINIEFDSNALAAPASFRNAVLTAASLMDAALTDNITVNIGVGYGEIEGTPVSSTSAEGGPNTGDFFTYSQIRSLLLSHASSGDTTFNSLPAGTSIQGQTWVAVWSAEEKALGLLGANSSAIDGYVGFGTGIPVSLMVGVALHEIGHAMGRIPNGSEPDIFDLFRFTSPGTRLFSGSSTAPAAYFSVDGGATDIADYGRTSDPSDFLNGSRTPEDSYNEYYDSGTLQHLTTADLQQLDALGFNLNGNGGGVSGGNGSKVAYAPDDFNDDARGDLLWRNTNGTLAEWDMNGSSIGSSFVTAGGAMVAPDASWSIAAISDFNNDGKADILWRNSGGPLALWGMNGAVVASNGSVTMNGEVVAPDASWSVVGAGDFNADGKSDVLWRNTAGATALWEMSGSSIIASSGLLANGVAVNPDPSWSVAGVGDFNGDSHADVLWRNSSSGMLSLWTMNGATIVSGSAVTAAGSVVAPDASWTVAGIGDFNGDGHADVLWRNSAGSLVEWLMNGSAVMSSGPVTAAGSAAAPDPSWHVVDVADFSGDGKSDIMWRNDNGATAEWLMNGTQIASSSGLANPDLSWINQNKPTNFA